VVSEPASSSEPLMYAAWSSSKPSDFCARRRSLQKHGWNAVSFVLRCRDMLDRTHQTRLGLETPLGSQPQSNV
jgi:hypothetical protein